MVTFVTGLTVPWDLGFTPDGRMLFTERRGVLKARLTDGAVQEIAADFDDLFVHGHTRLLALVADPNFASNRRFYTLQGHTGREMQVIAWTIDANYTTATRVADPLVGGMPVGIGRLHSGGRLLFGPQGYLWIAVGEGYSGTAPQDLSSLGGKVLRIDSQTGAAAPGNPFESSLVYVYGFRNPQGLALRPSTNQVWLVDHGPAYDDEINLLVAGDNYGWNPVPDEGAQDSYDETTTPMTDVVKFPDAVEAKWTSRDLSIAPSGGTFLEGDDWEDWEGRLAVAALNTQSLRIFEFTSSGDYVSHVVVPELLATYGRLRSPVLGPDGALYITTSNEEREKDRIFRVSASRAPAFLTDHETRYVSETLNAQGTVAKVVAMAPVTLPWLWRRSCCWLSASLPGTSLAGGSPPDGTGPPVRSSELFRSAIGPFNTASPHSSLWTYTESGSGASQRQTEIIKVALLQLLQCIRYTPGEPVASAQVQSPQEFEVSKLRRYLPRRLCRALPARPILRRAREWAWVWQ